MGTCSKNSIFSLSDGSFTVHGTVLLLSEVPGNVSCDMFKSDHSCTKFHAAARAISGGPIYLSDSVGSHDFYLIKQLVFLDGTTRLDANILHSLQETASSRTLFLMEKPFSRFGISTSLEESSELSIVKEQDGITKKKGAEVIRILASQFQDKFMFPTSSGIRRMSPRKWARPKNMQFI